MLKLALLLEKTHPTPGDFTRAFLEISFVTYLPLSGPGAAFERFGL